MQSSFPNGHTFQSAASFNIFPKDAETRGALNTRVYLESPAKSNTTQISCSSLPKETVVVHGRPNPNCGTNAHAMEGIQEIPDGKSEESSSRLVKSAAFPGCHFTFQVVLHHIWDNAQQRQKHCKHLHGSNAGST